MFDYVYETSVPSRSLPPTFCHPKCSLSCGNNHKISVVQQNKGSLLAYRATWSLRRALLHRGTEGPWRTIPSILKLHHLKLLAPSITVAREETAVGWHQILYASSRK